MLNASLTILNYIRICPGRYLAERIALLFAASVLVAYDIVPLDGESTLKPEAIMYEDSAIR